MYKQAKFLGVGVDSAADVCVAIGTAAPAQATSSWNWHLEEMHQSKNCLSREVTGRGRKKGEGENKEKKGTGSKRKGKERERKGKERGRIGK